MVLIRTITMGKVIAISGKSGGNTTTANIPNESSRQKSPKRLKTLANKQFRELERKMTEEQKIIYRL